MRTAPIVRDWKTRVCGRDELSPAGELSASVPDVSGDTDVDAKK